MGPAFAGLAALAIAMGIGRFAFTPLLPMMQADAGLGVVAGGWLASANYVGYLVGGLTAVGLRLGTARAIRAGLATVALTTLAMGFTTSFAAWLALRAAAGVGSAWVLVFAGAWCLERFQADPSVAPAGRAYLAATLYSGVGIGIAVTGLACLALFVAGIGSRGGWVLLGAVSILAAAMLWHRFDAGRSEARAARGSGLQWNGYFARLVVAYGAFGFGYIVPATFLAAMAREVFPDPAVYGWSWPIFGAAAAVSTFAAAAVRRALNERSVWIAGHVIMAAGVAVPLLLPGIAGIALSALLVGGTFMVVTMVGMQEARRVAGASARSLMAALTSSFAAGQIAGPLLVSALAARGSGYGAALAISAGALMLGALILVPPPPGDLP
jgi:predicted MFS family arabinose efflux permease